VSASVIAADTSSLTSCDDTERLLSTRRTLSRAAALWKVGSQLATTLFGLRITAIGIVLDGCRVS